MTLALQILLDLVAGLAAPFQRGHRIADRALLHNLFQQVGNLRIMFFNRFASASSSTNSVPVPAQGSTAVKFLDPLENGGLRQPTHLQHSLDSSPTESQRLASDQPASLTFVERPYNPLEQRRFLVDTTHARSMSRGVRIGSFIFHQSLRVPSS